MRSMHDIELLVTWAGLSITCFYQADDVRESISCPVVLIEHSKNSLFILLISK